ncbi:ABC-type branched-subunit amino acid transport system substrate-binding protein [Bradyrhizobium liaoningense]
MCRIMCAAFAAALAASAICPSHAQQAPLKIGVLSDFSSVYSDIGGIGNVEATKMAIEDFGGQMFGKPIDMLSADVLNKPDVASTIARKWWETEGVDMIIDLPTSATALAVMELSKQYEKIMIVTDAASSDITGKSCSPYTAHWTYDTYANAHTVGSAIVKNGGDTWFFLTADYVFGHSVERDTGDVVKASAAARCWAASSIPSTRRTSPRSCFRPRHPRPKSSASRTAAATPSTRSSRPASSASLPGARTWLRS